ncbi:MAG TPA: SHOCT domain-containing protein [Opitutus sp.]|nr:SHOCT domain-containing protein [Opitutus sp.]
MKPRIPLLAAVVCLGLATTALASSTLSQPQSLGDNLYAITNTARTAFSRDVDALRGGAVAAAKKFCAARGDTMKIVSAVTDTPRFGLGYYSVKLIFKPLKAGDPELTEPASAQPSPAPAAIAPAPGIPVANSPTGTGDYYNDLLKLDDLHKRGIITDQEFERQKKKILKDWK